MLLVRRNIQRSYRKEYANQVSENSESSQEIHQSFSNSLDVLRVYHVILDSVNNKDGMIPGWHLGRKYSRNIVLDVLSRLSNIVENIAIYCNIFYKILKY